MLTNTQIRGILISYAKGTPISKIAENLTIAESTVRYHLKRSKKGREILPLTDKEKVIEEKGKTIPAREIAVLTSLQENTTRCYACSRHISLEYDHIAYTPRETKEMEKYLNGTSRYTSVADLARAFNRSYSSVYQKLNELKAAAATTTVTVAAPVTII